MAEDSIELADGQSLVAESGTTYRNVQPLGQGGNAATFLVVATKGTNRGVPFAAKIFRRMSESHRRDSFLQEMSFLETCNHPSVLRVYDTGIFLNKAPFFISEYLSHTLRQTIRAEKPPLTVKLSFATQILSALAYLSSLPRPIIHRDIKPENIFIKGHSCVLGDFGLLKRIEDAEHKRVLKESLGVGMPARYRTPDQVAYLRGRAMITSRSDIFQLGLVLAELFTGHNPEKPAKRLMDAVQLAPLRPMRGELAVLIADIIEGMLAMDPKARPSLARLCDAWEGIFGRAVTAAHAMRLRPFP